MAKLVTLVTEGITNYIIMPNGEKRNLGPISPLKIVCAFYTNKREARQLLDRLLEKGTTMLRVDLDKLELLLEPRRWETYPYRTIRWAKEERVRPLMQTENCGGSVMDRVEQIIRKIEARTSYFNSRVAEGKEVTSAEVQGVKELVQELKDEAPKGQSKNDYFYFSRNKKEAAVESQLNDVLDKISATRRIVDRLEANGRKFNASRARADLLDVANKVRNLLARDSISEKEAQPIVNRVNEIHGLFAGAK